jgi:hypothetical protein
VQAKRDTESSNFSNFWMPVFTGMTALITLFDIAAQSLRGNDSTYVVFWFLTTKFQQFLAAFF